MTTLIGVAKPDTAATNALDGVWINLTANDNPSYGWLTVTGVDLSGTDGTAAIVPGATNGVWYSPGSAFHYLSVGQTATDTFTYTVTDSNGDTASAPVTVTITGVNLPPVANPEKATTDAQHGVWLSLTANNSDPNLGDSLSVASVNTTGTKGIVSLNPNATNGAWYSPGTAFDYLSVGETATDRFSYTISDGHGGTATSYATITVTGVNLPPVANPDSATTDSQHGVWVNLTSADTDPNRHDTLTVTGVDLTGTKGSAGFTSGATNGVWYSPGGAFDYLGAGQTATDTFSYTISDGHGGTATSTATVTITGVNLPPVATPTTATTDSQDGLWINLTDNASDPNSSDRLSVVSVGLSGTRGAVGLNPKATNGVVYLPNHAFDYLSVGETATDTFSYTISDGHGQTVTSYAAVTVTGVNLPPVAVPESATTDSQHGVWVDLLVGDSDPNRDDTITVTALGLDGTKGVPAFSSGATNGVWYSPNSAFDYLNAGQTATDTFDYTISDGHGGTSTSYATVTVTGVNLPPVANPIAAATGSQGNVIVDLAAAASDPNQGDTFSVASLDLIGTHGTVTLNADGTDVVYAPNGAFDYLNAGETATDWFGYTVSDAHGATATSFVSVTVDGVNLPPVARPLVATTDADHGLWLNLMGSVSDRNSHDVLTITGVDTSGTAGSLSFTTGASGAWYSPGTSFQGLPAGHNATDSFTYTVSDGHGDTTTNTATVTIDASGALTVPGKAFYVATNGNDNWSGRLAQPNAAGTDGPFATLGAAQKAMEFDLTTQTTYVEGGDYYLGGAPLNLSQVDSGQTWSTYNGQTVDLHGGAALTGWTDQGNGIWTITPPAGTMAQGGAIDTLYINGVAQTDARFPEATPGVPASGWLTATASLPGENAISQFQFAPGSIPTSIDTNDLYAEVFTQNGWCDVVSPITSINYATDQITLADAAQYSIGAGSRFCLMNAGGLLSTAGDYSYDPVSNVLTYKAAAGFDGTGAVVGNAPQIVGIYGAQNITLSGLTIGDGQSTGYALQILGSSNIKVQSSTIDNAGTGILLGGASGNIQLLDNTIENLSGSGILVTPGVNNITADGNHIQNIGALTSGSGIWFTGSSNDVFSNNVVQNTAKVGIGGGSVLGSSDASYNDVITHNTISNANQQTADSGGIYLINRQQDATGDTISYNTVSNTWSWAPGHPNDPTAGLGAGVYLDDFSNGVTVQGNLLQGNVDGVWVHLGSNNTIENNVVTSSLVAGLSLDGVNNTGVAALHPSTGNLFKDNTVYSDHAGSIADVIFDAVAGAGWAGNTYGGPAIGAQPFSVDISGGTATKTFAQWQAMGFDTAASGASLGPLTLAQALANLPAG